MKVLRTIALIGLGMVLATVLLYGVNAVRAQGPGGMMGSDRSAMHAQMHHGATMPADCTAMMADSAMHTHMAAMMAGGAPMTPDEARTWMEDAGIPADVQGQCLDPMTAHHPPTAPAE